MPLCFRDDYGYHATSDFCFGEPDVLVRADLAIFQFHSDTAERHAESRRDVVSFGIKLFRRNVWHAHECHHDVRDLQRTRHRAKLNGDTDSDVGCERREVCFGDDHGHGASDFSFGESDFRVAADFAINRLHGDVAERHAEPGCYVVTFGIKLFRSHVRHTHECHHDVRDIQRSGHRAEFHSDVKSGVGCECLEIRFRDDHGYHATSDFCSGESDVLVRASFAINRLYGDVTK